MVSSRLAELLSPRGKAGSVRLELGTVTAAPGTDEVTVQVGGSQLVLPYLRSYAPAVNDSVVIAVQGQRWIVVDAYAQAADPPAPRPPAAAPSQPPPKPPTPPVVTQVTRTFNATGTGCFRDGKWRTDTDNQPHQGDWGSYGRNTGAWFYGRQIATTLAGATVVKAEVRIRRLRGGQYGPQSPTVFTTPHRSKPSGAPTLLGSGTDLRAIAVDRAEWVPLPLSLAQQFSDGTAFGLACKVSADDPYMAFASLNDARDTGALRLTWKKVS